MRYLVFFLCFWILPTWAQAFLPGTEEIPLMAGLVQVEETASFNNPAERMVLIEAETKESAEKVLRFYTESLSNLGWVEKASGQFERGADSFLIEITPYGSINQIQFRLSQRNP